LILEFEIATAGYQQFTLESLNAPGQAAGDLQALAAGRARLRGRAFQSQGTTQCRLGASCVSCERRDQRGCVLLRSDRRGIAALDLLRGLRLASRLFGHASQQPHRAPDYFQRLGQRRRKQGSEQSRRKDRVTLVAKGDGVFSGDFGNEGTGGHSHLVCDWKTGQKQRFLVTAKPTDATHTIYAGYWFQPEQQKWMLISSWKAPKDGGYLHGLYSFVENFGGSNGQLLRKALYGNQWFRTPTASGTNRPPRPSATTQPAKPTAWIVSWVSRTASFSFRPAVSCPSLRLTARALFTRPPSGHPPTDFVSSQFSEK
jgi:hypothetical protein